MVSTGLENPETWLGEDIYQNLNVGVRMKKFHCTSHNQDTNIVNSLLNLLITW